MATDPTEFAAKMAAARTAMALKAVACVGNDPTCPCQDGDACHYKSYSDSPAWPVSERVEVLSLQPGDTLMVIYPKQLAAVEVEMLRDRLRERLAIDRVVVLDSGPTLKVVRDDNSP